jgi:hypothetical protein
LALPSVPLAENVTSCAVHGACCTPANITEA